MTQRKRQRSKYGDPRIGRAVCTVSMSLQSASNAMYFIKELGGVPDAQLLGRWFELLRHLNMHHEDLTTRECQRHEAARLARQKAVRT